LTTTPLITGRRVARPRNRASPRTTAPNPPTGRQLQQARGAARSVSVRPTVARWMRWSRWRRSTPRGSPAGRWSMWRTRAARLYEDGWLLARITAEFSIHTKTTANNLRQVGVGVRPRGAGHRHPL